MVPKLNSVSHSVVAWPGALPVGETTAVGAAGAAAAVDGTPMAVPPGAFVTKLSCDSEVAILLKASSIELTWVIKSSL